MLHTKVALRLHEGNKSFNPFWDASRLNRKDVYLTRQLLSIPFGMLHFGGNVKMNATIYSFNPFWDASYHDLVERQYLTITFNPFWDASAGSPVCA